MFSHTRYVLFTRRPLITITLISVMLAGLGAGVLWRGLSASAMRGSSASGGEDDAAKKARLKREYGRLPMNFEVNQGQADGAVKYLSRGHGYQVFLTGSEAALVLSRVKGGGSSASGVGSGELGENRNSLPTPDSAPGILRIKPAGARDGNELGKQVIASDLLQTKSNYLIGDDSSKWRTGIPNYARVEYSEVYPGINLAFYGTQQALEYDFIVAPGADPDNITISIEGADKIELDDQGDLVLSVAGEKVYHRSPLSYQGDNRLSGARRDVKSRYILKGGNQVGFAVENYDASKPLVIDPVIDFSTFLGGKASDEGFSIAVDGQGNAYVTGTTYSNNFNTVAPLQPSNRGGHYDAYVSKVNATGSALVYSTYLGGTGDDSGHGITVDSSGSAYVAGITNSFDFTTTTGAFQRTKTGASEDAFITKIGADGAGLVFSTYLGGSDIDQAFAIAVDSVGDAYVAGSTASSNFRTTTNALYKTNAAPPNATDLSLRFDAFYAKIKGDGTQLIYSTYLGGNGFDEGYGIAVDSSKNAYIVGLTGSSNFKIANPSAPQPTRGGLFDAFLTVFNATGSALLYSTYLGGAADDAAYGIALDAARNPYITGQTFSANFPVTDNARQGSNNGNADVFVTRINNSSLNIDYSTYLGGAQGDFARGIAVDSNNNVYIAGRTASTDYPTSSPLQSGNRGALDAFVTKLDISAIGSSQLVYSTYLGGANEDQAAGIAIDSTGAAYVMGDTRSNDFNVRNPLQAANRGGSDAFVSKLNSAGSALVYSTYLGGAGEDLSASIALDSTGNAYITGYTNSSDYTTQSPIQSVSRGGLEAFVTKVFSDASAVAFNTYFGGSGTDVGNAIAVDINGNCYITGATTSTNLPVRPATPLQATNRGGNDAFVAKIDTNGTNIIYSTYLGGTFGDLGRDIAVDLAGSAFITGSTFSDNFPATTGVFQATNRGQGDVFVTRLNPAGTALSYSSFLGGAGTDDGAGIAIDDSGNAYVVGTTASGDFNTRTPLQATNRGGQDVFIAKVNPAGAALVFSTYLGGKFDDLGSAIAVDSVGDVYVTGSTGSPLVTQPNDFPVLNPAQAVQGGDLDAFVTKIRSDGSALLASTFLGGSMADVGNSIAVDPFGNIYVTGVTNSPNYPTTNPIQAQNRGGADAFVTKLPPSVSVFLYSTYLGGGGDDRGVGVAVDSAGTAYVTGATSSPDFPTQFPLVTYGGGSDVFIAKLISEPALSLTPALFELQALETRELTVSISGPQTAPLTVSLTSSNTAVATVPASVVIAPGEVTGKFILTAVAAGGPITITAALPAGVGGATATATVTVIASNRFIRAATVSAAAGRQVTVPIELVSQGNENRVSFSIKLDQTLLLTPNLTLGADATTMGATLNVNNQAASGRYGVSISLPSGGKFTAGTRQILVLNAVTLTGVNGMTTPIDFTSQPTTQRVSDVNNLTLSATYTSGSVTIAQGFEGDVSPRPSGSNGTLTIADWVQMGRFAAGIDTPTAGSEFQRADTAPRASLGDGAITVLDWVQTGRYTAGLDQVTPAGGPTAPTSLLRSDEHGSRIEDRGSMRKTIFDPRSSIFDLRSAIFNPQSAALDLQSQARVVRVANASGQRGQQVTVTVELDSQGNENALGFSLNFNPNDLMLVNAAPGPDANAPCPASTPSCTMFITNPTDPAQATNGRLGVLLSLPSGLTYAAGTRKLVTLTFAIPAAGTATTIPIMFGNQPVVQEIVDATANVLQATWTPGAVTIGSITRPLVNVSAASFVGGELAAEQIVAAAGTGLATQSGAGGDSDPVMPGIQLPTTLNGTTVSVRDSAGMSRLAPLFFVSAGQVNYLMPTGTAPGTATVTITSGDGTVSAGDVTIAGIAPGIFFVSGAAGQPYAAALALRVKADNTQIVEPIVTFDTTQNAFVPIPIDLGPPGEQVFLLLFGTGWRGAGGPQMSSVTIGSATAVLASLGPQGGFVGLDQANVIIPRSLIGAGEVDVKLTVGLGAVSKIANTVKVNIK